MFKSVLLPFMALLLSLSAFAESKITTKVVQLLQSKSFLCVKARPEQDLGFRCRGKIKDYPLAVNIFVPANLRQRPCHLALHFHGHTNCPSPECHFDVKSGNGDYAKMLSTSATKSLLVVPESLGKVQTYREHFTSPTKFEAFVEAIKALAELNEVESLKLSSHSGGDVMIERLASWPNSGLFARISKVALFDSLYARRAAIPRWILKMQNDKSDFYFLGSYVIGPEASTEHHMRWLASILPANAKTEYRALRCGHMQIMRLGGMSEFLAD